MRRPLVALIAAFALLGNATALGNSVAPSAWDQPALASPTYIQLSDASRNLKLDQTKDYVLTCPSGTVLATWGLVVWGGHNVVLDGCPYSNSSTSGAAAFKNQTGTLWVHDVHFIGTQQTEGIDLQEPGTTTVVLRDVLIDRISGSFTTNHADLLQTWSGPRRLLIDGYRGDSGYQGMFLLPNQQDPNTSETTWDVRHAEMNLNPGGYVWTFGTNGPQHVDMHLDHVYVTGPGQPLLYMGGEGGEDIQLGPPPNGDYVWATPAGARGVDDLPVDPMPYPGELN